MPDKTAKPPERVTQYFGHGPKVTAVDYIRADVHERVVSCCEQAEANCRALSEDNARLRAEVEQQTLVSARLRKSWHEDTGALRAVTERATNSSHTPHRAWTSATKSVYCVCRWGADHGTP